MEWKEMQTKNSLELKVLLAEHCELLRNERFQTAMSYLKQVRQLRKTRKMVARILTLMKQKKNAEKLAPVVLEKL